MIHLYHSNQHCFLLLLYVVSLFHCATRLRFALKDKKEVKLDELKEVQQKEIMMYFGLDDYPQMDIREIAKVRGVSFQAVQMSLARSLKKLRTAIHLYLKFE